MKLCPSSACKLTCAAMAASRWLSKNTKNEDVGREASAAALAVEILASSARTRRAKVSTASTVGGANVFLNQRIFPLFAAVLSLIVGLRASRPPLRAISHSKRASAASRAAQARSHFSKSRSTSLCRKTGTAARNDSGNSLLKVSSTMTEGSMGTSSSRRSSRRSGGVGEGGGEGGGCWFPSASPPPFFGATAAAASSPSTPAAAAAAAVDSVAEAAASFPSVETVVVVFLLPT